MGSNSFGRLFQVTTWGESHGKAMGALIDGCLAHIEISAEEIGAELRRRAPGLHPLTSPRKEPDEVEIYSGIFEGKTTGTPISLIIFNKDVDSSKYEPIKEVLRPGHASYTYLQKYGIFDYRGGGRASGRETVCRVAAGAVAKKMLMQEGIEIFSRIVEVGGSTQEGEKVIQKAKEEGDSVGGVIEVETLGLFAGLGEPIYEKMEALLAQAMLSLPAVRGFEIGSGFRGARMRGSEHNDLFYQKEGKVMTRTNHAGGVLAGITTGMPLLFRVAFTPPSSISREQKTLDTEGREVTFSLPEGSRHDPCVLYRALPVVEAMTAFVLADMLLMYKARSW